MSILLEGFERLIAVCQRAGYPADLLPPGEHPPALGAQMAGHALDPILAAVYRRFAQVLLGGTLGDLHLYPVDDESNGIEAQTEELRRVDKFFEPYVLFAGASGLAYYYAVVPMLADSSACQPVVFIKSYDERPVYPVASNVDRFFDLYSRYIELLAKDEAFLAGEPPDTLFPLSIAPLVARDRRLVEMLAEGRFDSLVSHSPGSLEWVKEVCSARPG